MHYISGEDRNQISVLPPSIDEYVTDENPVRVIDAFVDSLDMTAMGFERSSLNSTGRPPYANQDMLKLYIYMVTLTVSAPADVSNVKHIAILRLFG